MDVALSYLLMPHTRRPRHGDPYAAWHGASPPRLPSDEWWIGHDRHVSICTHIYSTMYEAFSPYASWHGAPPPRLPSDEWWIGHGRHVYTDIFIYSTNVYIVLMYDAFRTAGSCRRACIYMYIYTLYIYVYLYMPLYI
jgi:hypothetical protein